ncbi:TolC family protein [bacterium]|nr:TolC family protein [bacterium]
MPNRLSVLILSLGIIIAATHSSVSGQVTLDDCISLSQSRNISLRRTILEQQLDLPASMAAWGQFFPSVTSGFSIDQSNNYTKTYVSFGESVVVIPDNLISTEKRRNSSYYFRIDETVFDSGRRYLNLKNIKLNERIRDSQLQYERFLLRSQVTTTYTTAIAALRRFDLSEKVVEQRRRQLEFAHARFETGSVTRRDMMQAEVDLGRALSDSLEALLERDNSLERLNLVIGFPLDTNYVLANLPSPFLPYWEIDSLVTTAMETRGDLISSTLRIERAHNDHLAAKGEFLPSVSTSYLYSRSEPANVQSSFTLSPSNKYSRVSLDLTWTLFDRFTKSLRLQEAKIRHQQSKLTEHELALDVRYEVSSAINHITALYKQAQVAAQNSRLSEETLKFEQERYRLGSATVIELGAAQLSFIQAKNDEINIETQFYAALGELELATGMELR